MDAAPCEAFGELVQPVEPEEKIPQREAFGVARGREVISTYEDMAELIRLGAYRRGEVREIMRPVALPVDPAAWGLCDGIHREAHEFVPA